MSEPKFKAGDLVRYASGSTALFWVTTIRKNHGGKGIHRYWGKHVLDGSHGAYESNLTLATAEERKKFTKSKGDK